MSLPITLAMFVVYVASSVTGLTMIKAAASPLTIVFIIGFGLYGGAFCLYYLILRSVPLSVAFPVAAGALTIGTQLAGFVYFKETISPLHLGGLVLILAGLTLVAWSGLRG